MGALVIILLKKENVTLYLCGFAGCSAALHICDFICGLVKLPAVDTLCPDFTDGNRHNQGRDLLKSALLLGHFLTWQDFHLSTWPLLHIDRYLPGSGGSWTSSPHCKHLMMASNHRESISALQLLPGLGAMRMSVWVCVFGDCSSRKRMIRD